jgi:hypothetical protein
VQVANQDVAAAAASSSRVTMDEAVDVGLRIWSRFV